MNETNEEHNTSIKATGNKRYLVFLFDGCASALLFSLCAINMMITAYKK